MFEKLKKQYIDMSVEELKEKKQRKKPFFIAYIVMMLILICIIGVLAFSGSLILITVSAFLLIIFNFDVLLFADMCNEINRINMWIYLKEKLE